jgi:hypothetical protein
LDQGTSSLGYLVRLVIGASVFLALMYFALRAISHFWRAAAEVYAGRAASPRIARKFPESIVITGRSNGRGTDRIGRGWHVFAPALIDVHEDALVLAMMPPFNIMCGRIVLPFSEMEMKETWWALWPQPVAIRMKRTPDIDIIVSRETARWIRDHVANRMHMQEINPSHNAARQTSHNR